MNIERINVIVSNQEEMVAIIKATAPGDGSIKAPLGLPFPFFVDVPASVYKKLYGNIGFKKNNSYPCEGAD